jgi:hypothetical protein
MPDRSEAEQGRQLSLVLPAGAGIGVAQPELRNKGLPGGRPCYQR